MTYAKLPVVISVPHGGTIIPKSLVSKCRLNLQSILLDGDTWSRELYNLHDYTAAYVDTTLARAVLDMNRAPDDRPPNNPDGVVKTFTVDQQEVWTYESGLPDPVVDELIRTYYRPYHQALYKVSRLPGMLLAIDCHTMLPIAPQISKNRGDERPIICISNRGDSNGNAANGPITAPAETVRTLRDALAGVFIHSDIECNIDRLALINEPFKGGYITWYHGLTGPLPWVQLEINRSIYMPKEIENINELPDLKISSKLRDIRNKLIRALEKMF